MSLMFPKNEIEKRNQVDALMEEWKRTVMHNHFVRDGFIHITGISAFAFWL